jgi:hypothetical protein
MSDKSDRLIDEFEYAVQDAVSDYMMACGAAVKHQARRNLEDYIADLEEFKAVVAGCGFEVITEPPVLNHPERKTLKGHGTIYVPTAREAQK